MSTLFTPSQRRFATTVADLLYVNPFLPERIDREREALGADFDEAQATWNLRGDISADQTNVQRLLARSAELIEACLPRLATARAGELTVYEDVVLFVLYYRFRSAFDDVIDHGPAPGRPCSPARSFAKFEQAVRRLLPPSQFGIREPDDVAHLFALFFQVRRAFHFIFRNIIGTSRPAMRFRADAWQSIFTHDLRRYRTALFDTMEDITTLVTGPSGTGKELAARAIGMARYIPFDAKTAKFAEDFRRSFHPVNLSALSPTLIESELFGHVRGAFTGAIKDHRGRLEQCRESGTVFLDEIGELDPAIQVKLLRVLQTRQFRRVGASEDQRFTGKVIAATNRNLADEMQARRFREDLYYRLCSDVVVAPSLRERLADQPDELSNLIEFIAKRLAPSAGAALADEVDTYIATSLGSDYDWPGNVRELEQCVRNVLVRGRYEPPHRSVESFIDRLRHDVTAGTLTVDELLARYCTLVYARAGTYEEAARRLQVDRRTVKARVDVDALSEIPIRRDRNR